VTGAGGFLGRYIVEALVARGDRVRGLARREYPELAALGVEMIRGDVRDPKTVGAACRGVDCVFHTAARPGIDMQWRKYDTVNRQGTLHVIAGCRDAGVGRLVYTSSPSVVFAGVDQNGCDESVPYDFAWMRRNRAYYSLTKALAEQEVLQANGESLRTCALRPHLIWGPRDGHLVPRLIARAGSGRLRRVGAGVNLVDMIYVENAAEAHVQAADALGETASAVGGKAYFLSQCEPVNCWRWIDEILALVDLPPVTKSMSLAKARRIGLVCEAIWTIAGMRSEPPMTRFLASQLATSHWFDVTAARRDFGYQPRVSTAEGMRRLGDWLRGQR
jgi:nucleoside-diphosphate-sugar epimerase